jgi:protocatechuate 3,4-dioxygenase beta subunit
LPLSFAQNAGANACGVTESAPAGPYYVANAARVTNINVLKMRGTPMLVAGVIRGQDGAALADALVEIWHCDAEGNYHPFDQGDVKDFKPQQLNLRGIARTDTRGRYAFESIVPAQYSSRRRHIHWKVSAPGHRTLITQSYWLADKASRSAARDFVDRNPNDCRYVDFKTANGVSTGAFDVVLAKA